MSVWPGWMRVTSAGPMRYEVTIRTWHPSMWPWIWRHIVGAMRDAGLLWSPRAWLLAIACFARCVWPWGRS